MTFSLDVGRGGIGIFGSRKSGSKCGESSPVDIRRRFVKEEYNLFVRIELRQKVIVAQQLFAPKYRHRTPLPKLLTPTPDMV